MGSVNLEQRLQTLARHFRPDPPPAGTSRAAVLVCLLQGDNGDLRVILTKRASTRDDDVATALREAKEEIGLEPSQVNVVTVLKHFVNKQGMPVVPDIGVLNGNEAFKPAPNSAEVEAVFDAPLEMFIKDDNRKVEMREWNGVHYLIHIFDYEIKNNKYTIWGLTSSILIRAASVVYQRRPPFVEHYSYKVFVEREDNGMGLSNLEQRLQALAQHFRLLKPTEPGLSSTGTTRSIKRAAVLVCLFQGLTAICASFSQSEPQLSLLILCLVVGEVALPGSKRDQNDVDDVDTALREAKEEIGLDLSLVSIVTILEPIVNKLGLPVVPVIGLLSNKKAVIPASNPAEVEAIFYAPLEMFLKDENRRAEERKWMGDKYLLHHFNFEEDGKEYVIWVLTAGILIMAASLVYRRQPAFLECWPKFWGRSIHDTMTQV